MNHGNARDVESRLPPFARYTAWGGLPLGTRVKIWTIRV